MNWRRLFRDLAEGYGWTLAEIGELTLYQLRYLTSDKDDLKGTFKMSAREFRALKAAKQKRGD